MIVRSIKVQWYKRIFGYGIWLGDIWSQGDQMFYQTWDIFNVVLYGENHFKTLKYEALDLNDVWYMTTK